MSYYEEMGRSAYHYVSQSYTPKSNVFKELSLEFTEISEILFFIQKRSTFQSQKKYFLSFASVSFPENLKKNKISH